ncbi:hypothetical protein LguiA_009722 [Lonicera macranthoides]
MFFLSILNSIFSENLACKVVIITGASSGIGEFGSPDVVAIYADVSNVDDCKRLVDQTIDHFGRLDHLVNNAGIASVCMFEDVDDITDISSLCDVLSIVEGKKGTGRRIEYRVIAKCMPLYNPIRSSASEDQQRSPPQASKAAVAQFFETLRVELGPDVKITLVTPGYIVSELTQSKLLQKGGRLEVKVTHLWRLLCPEVLEWSYCLLFTAGTGDSPKDAYGKKILNVTGTKELLYPDSIKTPESKTDSIKTTKELLCCLSFTQKVRGFYNCCHITQFAIPHLRNNKVKIIAIASCGIWLPAAGLNIYCATKAAQINFYETLVTPEFTESEITNEEFKPTLRMNQLCQPNNVQRRLRIAPSEEKVAYLYPVGEGGLRSVMQLQEAILITQLKINITGLK